jgi:hypothetical protein
VADGAPDPGRAGSQQGLGRTQLALGDATAALAAHGSALALATDLAQPLDVARASLVIYIAGVT